MQLTMEDGPSFGFGIVLGSRVWVACQERAYCD